MPTRHILIVAVDGLRASALGAGGNTMYPTPALDQFAAESFLLDSCYAPSSELAGVYTALWQAVHPGRPKTAIGAAPSLPPMLAERGYKTTLISDAPQLTIGAARRFDELVQLDSAGVPVRAADISQTSLAQLFGAASEQIAAVKRESPSLIWVHSRGMYGPWDAPLELQQNLLDEGDPPPLEAVAPPDLLIGDNDDSDVAYRHAAAYAAQIMVFDACWQGLMEALQSSGNDNDWLVVLVGVRGFPLGEHGRIGAADPRLYGEQLHVPWLLRFPDGLGRLARSSQLASPFDLLPTLLAWLGGGDHGPLKLDGMSALPLISAARPPWRESLVALSAGGQRAIRTAEWCLRCDDDDYALAELYVRPDDRWEFNDVAKLCPDVVDDLSSVLNGFLRGTSPGESLSIAAR
jgi:arylsulfatase A-like enzyme